LQEEYPKRKRERILHLDFVCVRKGFRLCRIAPKRSNIEKRGKDVLLLKKLLRGRTERKKKGKGEGRRADNSFFLCRGGKKGGRKGKEEGIRAN